MSQRCTGSSIGSAMRPSVGRPRGRAPIETHVLRMATAPSDARCGVSRWTVPQMAGNDR